MTVDVENPKETTKVCSHSARGKLQISEKKKLE